MGSNPTPSAIRLLPGASRDEALDSSAGTTTPRAASTSSTGMPIVGVLLGAELSHGMTRGEATIKDISAWFREGTTPRIRLSDPKILRGLKRSQCD